MIWIHLEEFRTTELDTLMRCMGCQKPSRVAVWSCGCGNLWHRCPLHRGCGGCNNITSTKLKTGEQNRASAAAKKRAKTSRQVGPDSFQWLLAQDTTRDKRKREIVDEWDSEPTIMLGSPMHHTIKPSFLSRSLKRRFLE